MRRGSRVRTRRYYNPAMKDRPRMPAPPPQTDSAVRLDGLRALALALLEEVDSIAGGDPLVSQPGVDFPGEVRRFEADLIRRALARAGGCRRGAAGLLNLKVSTLNAMIKRRRIRPDAFETATGS